MADNCTAQGFFVQMFTFSSAMWSTIFAHSMYTRVKESSTKFEATRVVQEQDSQVYSQFQSIDNYFSQARELDNSTSHDNNGNN